jgi:hypothetical protein
MDSSVITGSMLISLLHTMNYNLNSKKVLGKKIEASERELDCDIQLKSGTLVLT